MLAFVDKTLPANFNDATGEFTLRLFVGYGVRSIVAERSRSEGGVTLCCFCQKEERKGFRSVGNGADLRARRE